MFFKKRVERHTVEVQGRSYPLTIHTERRNGYRATITSKGIIIRVSTFTSQEQRIRQVEKLKQWAIERIEKDPTRYQDHSKTYNHGDLIKIGEKDYSLHIQHKPRRNSAGLIKENTIYLSLVEGLSNREQQKHISTLLGKCIAIERLPHLEEKIKHLNGQHFNQDINQIKFKNMTSRWGSCSRQRNINISTRLLFAPTEVLEYVCIHELAHLIEFNHSDRFWNLVEQAMPSYKEKEKWLKQQGRTLSF